MARRRIHLVAPAGAARPFLAAMNARSPDELIAAVQEFVGDACEVTADARLLTAEEDERHGGRSDDERRATDIEHCLADDAVAALVALRGGAWFSRILPRIDFSALDRRTRAVFVFGFSELTTLVNIVAAHPRGVGVYTITPGFLLYGMRHYAATRLSQEALDDTSPANWMRARLHGEVRNLFQDIVRTLEGSRGTVSIPAELVAGPPPQEPSAVFVGGNLTVLSTLIGSRYEHAIDPNGRWLLLEDFNDKPERFDRFLAHLTLAGYWERCAGVLSGNFHQEDRELTDAVVELLHYHLPVDRTIPVLKTDAVGHIWPATPLILHRPITIRHLAERGYMLEYSEALASSSPNPA